MIKVVTGGTNSQFAIVIEIIINLNTIEYERF
jgi:hypothetical protein